MTMTDPVYAMTQNDLLDVAKKVKQIQPLGLFLDRINSAQAAGPILEPTLYRTASNLDVIKRLAQTLKPFQDELKRLMVAETNKLIDELEIERKQRLEGMYKLAGCEEAPDID